MKQRIAAIDFGLVKTGIALSDPLHILAKPLITIVYPRKKSYQKKNSQHPPHQEENTKENLYPNKPKNGLWSRAQAPSSVYLDIDLQEIQLAITTHLTPHLPLEKLIMGWPLHLNGTESPMTKHVKALATLLETSIGCPILFWDERLTSIQVERHLKECGLKRKERAALIDGCSAALILQNYLDAKKEHTVLSPL